MKNIKIKNIIFNIWIVIVSLLFVVLLFQVREFKDESIEEYLFYSLNGFSETDSSIIMHAIKHYSIYLVLLFGLIYLLTHNVLKDKKCKFYPIKPLINHRVLFLSILSFIGILSLFSYVGVFTYIGDNISKSTLLEKEYISIEYEDIKFSEKRNLVLIYLESFETTFMGKDNGGSWDKNIVPELSELYYLDDSIYFATDDNKRGTYNMYGSNWTTASVVSSSTGIPFKIPMNNMIFNSNNYLRKVKALGDVLKYNGYHNEVISGAKTRFGGLYDFYKIHGDYEIIDPETVDKYNIKVNYDTKGSWGFNDKYMFDLAKERITYLAGKGIPFNETLLGIDSHPMDGYKTPFTLNKYDKQYENVYATDSMLLGEFIDWIKEQDFYKDTTIVIIGDHLCMQSQFIGNINEEDRGRINLFINSKKDAINTKNRGVSSYDLYPTIITSIGGDIKYDKIGLGTNLYSDEKTLIEKYGRNKVNDELVKKSDYYNSLLKE